MSRQCSAPVAVTFTLALVVSFAAMGGAVLAHLVDRLLAPPD